MLPFAALATALALTVPQTPYGTPQADTTNAVVGDAGFIARYGRAPGPEDDGPTRIRAHLAFVLAKLRVASGAIADPAARARRVALLGQLEAYAARGAFPHNRLYPGTRPVFIDEDGNICAVGYLIEASAGREAAEAIAKRWRYAFVSDMADPAIDAWAAAQGFSREELAMIQPSYEWERPILRPGPPRPVPPIVRPQPQPPKPAIPDVAILPPGAIGEADRAGTWTDHAGFEHTSFQIGAKRFLVRFDRDKNLVGFGTRIGAGASSMVWLAWYPTGELAARGAYDLSGGEERMWGPWSFYKPNGTVLSEGMYGGDPAPRPL